MTTAQMCIILAITVYLAAMIGVGVYFSRVGSSSSNDFYLGGRRLGPVVTRSEERRVGKECRL